MQLMTPQVNMMPPHLLAKKMLPHAIAAYSFTTYPPTYSRLVMGELTSEATPLIRRIKAEDLDPWGFITYEDTDMIISIRGTETASEWLNDINAPSVHFGGGKVHLGAYRLYCTIIKSVLTFMRPDTKRVFVTAHSLGGMLAQILVAELAFYNVSREIYLCTFESPRVGDNNFATTLERAKNVQLLRVGCSQDIFIHVPPRPCYVHVGPAHLAGGGSILHPHETHSLTVTVTPIVDAMNESSHYEIIR